MHNPVTKHAYPSQHQRKYSIYFIIPIDFGCEAFLRYCFITLILFQSTSKYSIKIDLLLNVRVKYVSVRNEGFLLLQHFSAGLAVEYTSLFHLSVKS